MALMGSQVKITIPRNSDESESEWTEGGETSLVRVMV
jgi:hypothetical protein